MLCGIGNCFDCLVDLDGERAVRACVTPLLEGAAARRSDSRGGPAAEEAASLVARLRAREDTGEGAREGAGENVGRGLGRSPGESADLLVVGGGPAGLAAARAATARGARVILVDGGTALGGQIFRQHRLAGRGGAAARRRRALLAPGGLPARYRHLAGEPRLRLALGRAVRSLRDDGEGAGFTAILEGSEELHGRAVLLAPGASELVLPFRGWELPGVVSAGAAQALWKAEHVLVGRRLLVAGSGPFLPVVAATLAEAGATVVAVVEAAAAFRLAGLAPALAAHPRKLAEAARYLAVLARHRVPLLSGRAVVACEGDENGVSAAVVARLDHSWHPRAGSERRVEVDAVCVSYGFVPRLELARQLGLSERRRRDHPAIEVSADAVQATSRAGVFAAGELTGVAGSEVAELEGALAGQAACDFLGLPGSPPLATRRRQQQQLTAARAFARRLQACYPLRGGLAFADDDSVVCRCEDVSVATLRSALAEGVASARELRGVTRCGMGYCQGRTCGPVIQLALAEATDQGIDAVGDLHGRPVAVPVYLGELSRPSGSRGWQSD